METIPEFFKGELLRESSKQGGADENGMLCKSKRSNFLSFPAHHPFKVERGCAPLENPPINKIIMERKKSLKKRHRSHVQSKKTCCSMLSLYIDARVRIASLHFLLGIILS
jgi:hypothetical protein